MPPVSNPVLFCCTVLLIAATASVVVAQPVPVDDFRQDQYRTLQLLSDSAVQTSLINLPLGHGSYNEATANGSSDRSWWEYSYQPPQHSFGHSVRVGLYEPVFTSTYNSRFPHGGNNGAAWYGGGLNTEIQSGYWLTSDFLTITFRPHFIYQQNKDFPTPRFIPEDGEGNPEYRAEFAGIDMPFRFGDDAYGTFDWGETSIRLHYKSIEAGISNESLWWGPAVKYPLMMSNNAPGLKHLFMGTRSPLPLPLNIGSIEFRLIGAWPEDSEYFNVSGADKDRFMNALNFSYAPSFIPNLAVGLTRAFHQYIPDEGLTFEDYTSIILPFQKTGLAGEGENERRNQLASVFFRWVFPESSAEIYGEYFREDHNYDLRDFLMQPDHDRAYSLGAQKVVESNWIDFFKLNVELTNLVPNRVDEVRPQVHYYSHSQIRQGHTNKGQVLGAAIGPGSGSQYFGVDGYFKTGQLGMFLQRVENNDFFHFEYYDGLHNDPGYKDVWRHWIQMNVGLKGRYLAGPVMLSSKLVWNKHFNYGRFDYGDLDVSFETFEGRDIVNWHFQISAQYLF